MYTMFILADVLSCKLPDLFVIVKYVFFLAKKIISPKIARTTCFIARNYSPHFHSKEDYIFKKKFINMLFSDIFMKSFQQCYNYKTKRVT